MNAFTQFCGIDVSKNTLDYCLSRPQAPTDLEYRQISNDMASIESAFAGDGFGSTLFVLEYTGSYSAKVLCQLSKMKYSVSVISPLQSKSFMSAQGITNKNDKQAARSLAIMGQVMNPKIYKAPTEDMMQRKQRLSTLRALEKQQRMLKNQLHALEQLPVKSKESETALEAVLEEVESQLGRLRECVSEVSKSADYKEIKALATSVVGIGDKTAEAFLLVTNGLEGFDNYDKVSKFLGLTPLSHHSGTSVHKKGSITKYGSGEVRGLLYMCTRSAVRYNLACKDLYQRLRQGGKPHKVAAVAVMHKLVKQLFACIKTKTTFDNKYHLSKNKK
jgi:transposase